MMVGEAKPQDTLDTLLEIRDHAPHFAFNHVYNCRNVYG